MMTHTGNNRGFTLVELAVVMIVTGVLLSAFTYPYMIYQKNKKIQTTNENIEAVTAALGTFRGLYGRYPCPASLTALRGSVEYGRESNCSDTSINGSAATNCVDGICIQNSVRTVQIPGTPASAPPVTITPRVRVGTLPFRQLGLDENLMYDGYNNKFIYAVTERLATVDGYDPNDGGIGIVNEAGTSAITPADSAHFFLFSTGANERGAFTRDGGSLDCDAARGDTDNCDFVTSATSVFKMSQNVGGDSLTSFDDRVSYFTKNDVSLWRISDDTTTDDIVQIPDGAVGFYGKTGSNPSAIMAQRGDSPGGTLRATGGTGEGRLLAGQLCQEDGSSGCFASNVIAGELGLTGGLTCPAGQFIRRIRNGVQECTSEATERCAANFFMRGFNSDGSIRCEPYAAPPKNCAAQTVTLCATSRTISAGVHNSAVTVTAGANFSRTYVCNNGNWIQQSQSGNCTCTPATAGRNVTCGTGFTGTYYQERTLTCPAGTWSGWVTVNATTCICSPIVETRNQYCQSGYTGAITQSRSHVCPADTWTPWTTISNTCACTPRTDTQQLGCGEGYTGYIDQTRSFQCPSATWTAWTTTANTCTCTGGTQTRNLACPSGHTGTIPQSRTFSCVTNAWSAWTATAANTCVPIPPVVCSWRTQGGGGSPNNYGIGNRVGTTCTCGSPVASCNDKLGENSFLNYTSCQCE